MTDRLIPATREEMIAAGIYNPDQSKSKIVWEGGWGFAGDIFTDDGGITWWRVDLTVVGQFEMPQLERPR